MRHIRFERDKIHITLSEEGEETNTHHLDLPRPDDRDLHLLAHLSACLCDGGREVGREHPRGEEWFEFFGQRLWERFPPDIGRVFEGEQARILLEFALSDREWYERVLGQAPWELLRFPVGWGKREPLGTSERLAVSRFVDVNAKDGQLEPLGEELRVLFVEATAGPPLRGSKIKAAIERHAGVRVIEWPPQQLYNCLRTIEGVESFYDLADERFDIVQILAHGHDKDGVRFRLADDLELTAAQLATFVRGRCRVVILQACSSSGAVRELLSAGPLGVIAMLYDINVDRMLAFNNAFYLRLLKGAPLDVAVQAGRRAIDSDARVSCCGAPILYVRTKDSIDVRRAQSYAAAAPAAGLQSVVPSAPTDSLTSGPPLATPARDEPLGGGNAMSLLHVLTTRAGT